MAGSCAAASLHLQHKVGALPHGFRSGQQRAVVAKPCAWPCAAAKLNAPHIALPHGAQEGEVVRLRHCLTTLSSSSRARNVPGSSFSRFLSSRTTRPPNACANSSPVPPPRPSSSHSECSASVHDTSSPSSSSHSAPEPSHAPPSFSSFPRPPPLLLLLLTTGAATAVACFGSIGIAGLIDDTEPLFAEASRQMLLTGDWVTPQFNAHPRFDKPPLSYWCMAASLAATSALGLSPPAHLPPSAVSVAALRFPSAAAAAFTALSLGATVLQFGLSSPSSSSTSPSLAPSPIEVTPPTLSKRRRFLSFVLSNHRHILPAIITVLSFSLSPSVMVWGSTALSDSFLLATVSGAVLSFFRGYALRSRGWYLSAAAFTALSVLAKGPVGLVLVKSICGTFLVASGDLIPVVLRNREFPILRSFVAFFALVGPWYAAMWQRHGAAYVDTFFGYHNVQRFTQGVNHHEGRPLWYPLLAAALLYFPWSSCLPFAVVRAAGESARAATRRNGPEVPRHRRLPLLALVWTVVPFAFFSLSKSQLPSYYLPMAPGVAMLVAALLSREGKGGSVEKEKGEEIDRNDKDGVRGRDNVVEVRATAMAEAAVADPTPISQAEGGEMRSSGRAGVDDQLAGPSPQATGDSPVALVAAQGVGAQGPNRERLTEAVVTGAVTEAISREAISKEAISKGFREKEQAAAAVVGSLHWPRLASSAMLSSAAVVLLAVPYVVGRTSPDPKAQAIAAAAARQLLHVRAGAVFSAAAALSALPAAEAWVQRRRHRRAFVSAAQPAAALPAAASVGMEVEVEGEPRGAAEAALPTDWGSNAGPASASSPSPSLASTPSSTPSSSPSSPWTPQSVDLLPAAIPSLRVVPTTTSTPTSTLTSTTQPVDFLGLAESEAAAPLGRPQLSESLVSSSQLPPPSHSHSRSSPPSTGSFWDALRSATSDAWGGVRQSGVPLWCVHAGAAALFTLLFLRPTYRIADAVLQRPVRELAVVAGTRWKPLQQQQQQQQKQQQNQQLQWQQKQQPQWVKEPLMMVGVRMPSAVFYAARPIAFLPGADAAAPVARAYLLGTTTAPSSSTEGGVEHGGGKGEETSDGEGRSLLVLAEDEHARMSEWEGLRCEYLDWREGYVLMRLTAAAHARQ